jgi:hypothetical protein
MSLIGLGIIALAGPGFMYYVDRVQYLHMLENRSILELLASDIPDVSDDPTGMRYVDLHSEWCASKPFLSRCVMSRDRVAGNIEKLLNDNRCYSSAAFNALRVWSRGSEDGTRITYTGMRLRELIREHEMATDEALKFVMMPDGRVCANNHQFKRILESLKVWLNAEIQSKYGWGSFQPI